MATTERAVDQELRQLLCPRVTLHLLGARAREQRRRRVARRLLGVHHLNRGVGAQQLADKEDLRT